MRILAFSDLHRDIAAATAIVAASRDADAVVGAGDFATRGQGASDTMSILREISVPFILVHGNHDDPNELRQFASECPNMHLLHGTSVKIEQTVFFGLGGEVPVRNDASWNTGLSEHEAEKLLAACPNGAVMVTHSPPYGHCDIQRDGTHEGSTAVLAGIERAKPSQVLCGHIHNAWGMRSKIRETVVHNVGPDFVWHINGRQQL